MKTSLEKIGTIRQTLSVEATSDLVEKAIDAATEKIRCEAKIPGFRKGKIPGDIIAQRFSEELNAEAIKELVRNTYPAAVRETQARPIGDPQIEPGGKIEKGKTFSYKANFEVYPEFTAAGYEGLKLEREKAAVDDEEVEVELRRLQGQMTQLEPALEAELGPGMVGMVDFKGTAGGKPFSGSEAENYVVDFGSGALLEEFEVEIKGLKAKEERAISFIYPASYFKKEIAGKKGEFKVKLKDLRRKIVPDLNDEFAKELGKFTSLDEVRADLKKRIAEYKDHVIRNMLREQAIRLLIEKHKELEVPAALVEAELGNMLGQMDRQLKARGQSLDQIKIDPREFVEKNAGEAANRARGYMIISAVGKQEKIEISDAEFEARISEIAVQNGQPVAKVKEQLDKNKQLDQLRSQMLFEKTLDFIVDKAKITDTKLKKEK
ncbi:MAG: trigger factor [Pseudomonadota bacterium]